MSTNAQASKTSAWSLPSVMSQRYLHARSLQGELSTRGRGSPSLPGLAGRSWRTPLFVVLAAGCGHAAASAPPGTCLGPAEDAALAGIEVRRPEDRPSVALVTREGDPAG